MLGQQRRRQLEELGIAAVPGDQPALPVVDRQRLDHVVQHGRQHPALGVGPADEPCEGGQAGGEQDRQAQPLRGGGRGLGQRAEDDEGGEGGEEGR